MQYAEVITRLKAMENPVNVAGMARFGIASKNTLGISIYDLRKLAKEIKKDHELALKLWESGIHEARILASFIEKPEKVTEAQLEAWVKDFDSWDVVDQVSELISKTPYATKKIHEWSGRTRNSSKGRPFPLSLKSPGMTRISRTPNLSNSFRSSKKRLPTNETS